MLVVRLHWIVTLVSSVLQRIASSHPETLLNIRPAVEGEMTNTKHHSVIGGSDSYDTKERIPDSIG